jgi:hypothetical protein
MTEIEKLSSSELAELRTDLAASRNLMAADRTLMAWVRVAECLGLKATCQRHGRAQDLDSKSREPVWRISQFIATSRRYSKYGFSRCVR